MAVIRVNKNKNYTVMSNNHFRDKRLSLKAKGLLSQMLSLPEDWDYSINGLAAINKESVGVIRGILKELKECGYLVVSKKMPDETDSGRIEYVYDIYEQGVGKQDIEKQGIEKQHLVFSTQLNTNNKVNNNKINNNTISKDIEKTPTTYGNEDINELFEEWEKHCGFKIDSKVKGNRYACNRLIKSRGKENVIKALPYVAESQEDKYAPTISNFMDLADKWNNLGVWVKKKKVTNHLKYGKIVIPAKERS